MNRVALITLLAMDCVSQAAAQSGTLNAGDRTFLMRDSRGAAYELASAKLAVQKASRNDIKGYAEKLVKDHEDYNTALENLGKQDGITLPTEPDAADKAHMAALQKLTGKAFDKLYVKEALRLSHPLIFQAWCVCPASTLSSCQVCHADVFPRAKRRSGLG